MESAGESSRIREKIMKHSRFRHSLSHAARGLRFVIAHERNFRLELFFAAAAIIGAALLRVSPHELAALFIVIFFVLVIEIVNTSLEIFLDVIKPRLALQAQVIKDTMAGAALCSALMAAVVGLLIFVPYVSRFLAFASRSGIL